MGNYYEGSFYVRMKKIPDTLKSIIEGIKEGNFKDEHSLFDSEHDYTRLFIETGIVLYLNDSAAKNLEYEISDETRFLDLSFESYNELLEEDKDFLENYDIKGYYIRVGVNMKGYKQELELFLDYIKSYIDEDMNPLVVGHIQDEDGYCDRDIVLNEQKFQEVLNSYDYLCSDCNNRLEHCFCPYYNLCKRAYDLGANNK